MNRLITGIFLCVLALTAPLAAPAQRNQPALAPAKLLDRLAGQWVMRGKLASRVVTHDVNVRWVLNREYIQFHEVSRPASPPYEAIVYIASSEKARRYTCLWLDSTAAAPTFQPIGSAMQAGNSIPFVIAISPSDAIHTTFAYDATTDRWHITIDDVNQGKSTRFGDVELTRRSAS